MRWLKEMLEGGFELKTGKKLLCPQSSWSTFSNVAAEFSFFLGISDFHLENLVFEAAWPQPCNWRSSVRSALFSPSGAWQICAQTSTFCSQKAAPVLFGGQILGKIRKKLKKPREFLFFSDKKGVIEATCSSYYCNRKSSRISRVCGLMKYHKVNKIHSAGLGCWAVFATWWWANMGSEVRVLAPTNQLIL